MPKFSPAGMRVGLSPIPTMRTFIKTGQAIVPDALLRAVNSINVGQPPKYQFDGQFVHFYVPESLVLKLNKIMYLPLNQGRLTAAMNNDLDSWLRQMTGEMQQLAASIVDKQIYETKPRLTRYKPRKEYKTFGKTSGTYRAFSKMRTFRLREAVIRGIQYTKGQIKIGIDENLAPYWVFVEFGHKVIIPRYHRRLKRVVPWEPGTIVEGRPFMHRIQLAIREFIKTRILPALNAYLDTAGKIIMQWVLGSTPGSVKLKYPEFGGRV